MRWDASRPSPCQPRTEIINVLDPRIRTDLEAIRERLLEQGELLSTERLQACYALFRERFGPEVLAGSDGEELLNLMHLHGSQDSLVYWLEFKNDEEFPAHFGSISGGSALKFGLYRRKATGEWMTGPSQQQRVISQDEAAALARTHRDELIVGASLLDALPADPIVEDYKKLQGEMDAQAPTVSRLAWGHKYFSLLYPDKLDDYHAPEYAHFHLIKMLQTPLGNGEQRYIDAFLFRRIANTLSWPLNHLTAVLNARDGSPNKVWLFNTRIDGDDLWPQMRDHGLVVTGPSQLGPLDWLDGSSGQLDRLKQQLAEHPSSIGAVQSLPATARAIRDFVYAMEERDQVLAIDANTVRGIGEVMGDAYQRDSTGSPKAPHQRVVEWRDLDAWQAQFPAPPAFGVRRLGSKRFDLLVAIERHLLDAATALPKPRRVTPTRLTGLDGEIQAILNRKGQVILYGPPGTGKTWHARRVARELAAMHAFGQPYGELSEERRAEIEGLDNQPGLVRVCTFHPAYGYEDFIEGYRPRPGQAGQLGFALRPGLFKRCCEDAANQPDQRFFLIIDEINRGDIPRIFGELLTLLEKDKRGQSVLLPLSNEAFTVPPNLYLIGTMNTADRSIALLDTALRRRFGFRELMPDMSLLKGAVIADSIPLDEWLDALNLRILKHVGRDARNLQIGHAYFLQAAQVEPQPVTDLAQFRRILAEDIVPLLEEYCYEDYETLAEIIGKDFIDQGRRRFKRELFQPSNRDNFIQALLAPTPDLTTSVELSAVAAENADEASDGEAGDDPGTAAESQAD